ncbi:MAG: hypothetical protein QW273_02710 [Candidatus Pacearchaeota archaeon]
MTLQTIVAIIGIILIIAGNFLISSSAKIRRRYTYPLLIAGGICMLIYSFYLGDKIFIILQFVFIAASIIGLIRINEKHRKNEQKNK